MGHTSSLHTLRKSPVQRAPQLAMSTGKTGRKAAPPLGSAFGQPTRDDLVILAVAARIVGVDTDTIKAWARAGHIRTRPFDDVTKYCLSECLSLREARQAVAGGPVGEPLPSMMIRHFKEALTLGEHPAVYASAKLGLPLRLCVAEAEMWKQCVSDPFMKSEYARDMQREAQAATEREARRIEKAACPGCGLAREPNDADAGKRCEACKGPIANAARFVAASPSVTDLPDCPTCGESDEPCSECASLFQQAKEPATT